MSYKLRECLAAGVLLILGSVARGQAAAPYATDANTVLLFHFDESSGGQVANAVAGKNQAYTWTFSSSTGVANTSLLGATSYSGFGKCMDQGSANDVGAGYELDTNTMWSWIVPAIGIVLTVLFWAAIYLR